MKITIVSIVCLVIVALIVSGCANYIGISKKNAAKNLRAYLQREYDGKLTFRDLNRFFNTATMNPNIFSVLIYDKNIPEIEFYTHINVKTLLEDDMLPMYATADAITFDNLYQEALQNYKIRQAVITDFKNEIPEIIFSHDTIILNFDTDLSPEKLTKTITRFIGRLNQSFKALEGAYNMSLHIKTPEYPEGFLKIPLAIETQKYNSEPYLLSEAMVGFEALKTKIEANIQAKIDTDYPHFKISKNRKIIMDKSTLYKGAWLQYLDDTRVKNSNDGKWINPQKGLYVVYFDLQSLFIYRGEMLTEENDKLSSTEESQLILKTIEEEGLSVR
ncbi:hypothetical protein [Winogradskyella vidalii]|uniref:hypothetical protein n=1 Tax=Winogradskyella vidalii TaxID=2615024 RepID=UPI0015C897B6|nr:hypothetical protein [Winogradskyella vidalii]